MLLHSLWQDTAATDGKQTIIRHPHAPSPSPVSTQFPLLTAIVPAVVVAMVTTPNSHIAADTDSGSTPQEIKEEGIVESDKTILGHSPSDGDSMEGHQQWRIQ